MLPIDSAPLPSKAGEELAGARRLQWRLALKQTSAAASLPNTPASSCSAKLLATSQTQQLHLCY